MLGPRTPHHGLAPYIIAATILLAPFHPTAALGAGCVAPPAGIVAWWPFDETTGTSAHDIVGTHDGTYVGTPQSTGGLVGGALRFNGLDTYVVVPDSDLWAFGTTDFTLEFWANFDVPAHGTSGHPGTVFLSNDNGPFINDKWILALSNTSLEFIAGELATGSDVFAPVVPFAPEVGRWYHLALTRSGTTYKIYVDGTQVGPAGTNLAVIPNPASPLTIGAALEPLGTGGGFGGVMNGRLDEVTIYHRALPEEDIHTIVSAHSAGKCKGVTVRTEHLSAMQFAVQGSQQLEAVGGTPPYTWSIVAGRLPPGLSFSLGGVLSGIPTETGSFGITMAAEDSAKHAAAKELVLDVLLIAPPPSIRVDISSTSPVPGRLTTFFVVVTNTGPTTASDVHIYAPVDSRQLDAVSAASPTPVIDDPSSVAVLYLNPVHWVIPRLAPGEVRVLTYTARMKAGVPIGAETRSAVLANLDVHRAIACYLETLFAASTCTLCALECGEALACVLDPELCLAVEGCARCIFEHQCKEALDLMCEVCFPKLAESGTCKDQQVKGAKDPNEKSPQVTRFVPPDSMLTYSVSFENVGNIEARDVFITDVLDAGLDMSTIEFPTGGIATIDGPTRSISWRLLNRNLGVGEMGSVSFSVRPTRGLPSGTIIRNKAKIQFEVFTPMDTNEVETIIDSTRPTCAVSALPGSVVSRRISVSWVSTDAIGEIESVSVLVSVDGGPFTSFQTDTKAVSATFAGDVGHSYGFLCVAKDTAGNVEIKGPMAEATTRVTGFGDVATDHLFFSWIQALFEAGLTGGCSTNPPQYCPNDSVTRGQMAVFLLRGIHGVGYQPPDTTGIFVDVPVTNLFAKWIEQLAREGITGGCSASPPQYCPEDTITRAQMAVFLLRAKHGGTYQPPAATGTTFTDVPSADLFAPWIEQLAREGITGGCGPGLYCPDASVTRGQMAVFLVRAFNLPM